MIEGLNIRCNVGPVEVLRSPFMELVFRRRAVVSRGGRLRLRPFLPDDGRVMFHKGK